MRKRYAIPLACLVLVGGCTAAVAVIAPALKPATTAATLAAPAASTSASPAKPAPAKTTAGVMQHAEDVKITACKADPVLKSAAAKVTVTNHSGKASNYTITVAFESRDGKTQIGTGLVAVTNLQPGQRSLQDANSLQPAHGRYVCKLADVTRYASG